MWKLFLKDWLTFLQKDKFQMVIFILFFFTTLFLLGQIPIDFYKWVAISSIGFAYGDDAFDNFTNRQKTIRGG